MIVACQWKTAKNKQPKNMNHMLMEGQQASKRKDTEQTNERSSPTGPAEHDAGGSVVISSSSYAAYSEVGERSVGEQKETGDSHATDSLECHV